MSIKLVVFDWNGTLLDDTHLIVQAMNESDVPLFGIEPMTLERYTELFEIPLGNFFLKLGVSKEALEKSSAERSELFLRSYEPLALKAELRKGARSTLATLHERGLRLIILSNHTLEGIYQQLARLEIIDFIDTVLANDIHQDVHHRGKQHRLEAYLKDEHIEPSEVVIIGDTPEEITIARSLGGRSISITGGSCSEHRLKEAGPDALIHSLEELVTITEERA